MTAEYFYHVEQNTPEWYELRTGIITCSSAQDILTGGKGLVRTTYLYKLAGELITGEPSESFKNKYTKKGHEAEPLARKLYQKQTGNNVTLCGFIKNNNIGFSPDGLIYDDGIIEIKRKLPHLLIEVLLSDSIPPEHVAQIQAGLMVSEREYCDFIAFYPGMPLFIKRTYRDEKYISNLRIEIDIFKTELNDLVEKISTML